MLPSAPRASSAPPGESPSRRERATVADGLLLPPSATVASGSVLVRTRTRASEALADGTAAARSAYRAVPHAGRAGVLRARSDGAQRARGRPAAMEGRVAVVCGGDARLCEPLEKVSGRHHLSQVVLLARCRAERRRGPPVRGGRGAFRASLKRACAATAPSRVLVLAQGVWPDGRRPLQPHCGDARRFGHLLDPRRCPLQVPATLGVDFGTLGVDEADRPRDGPRARVRAPDSHDTCALARRRRARAPSARVGAGARAHAPLPRLHVDVACGGAAARATRGRRPVGPVAGTGRPGVLRALRHRGRPPHRTGCVPRLRSSASASAAAAPAELGGGSHHRAARGRRRAADLEGFAKLVENLQTLLRVRASFGADSFGFKKPNDEPWRLVAATSHPSLGGRRRRHPRAVGGRLARRAAHRVRVGGGDEDARSALGRRGEGGGQFIPAGWAERAAAEPRQTLSRAPAAVGGHTHVFCMPPDAWLPAESGDE